MDDSFVATQNVSHFRELLSRERQPDRGSKLLDLLGAELAKLPEPARRLELIKTARYLIERSRLSYPIDAGQMTPTEMRDKAEVRWRGRSKQSRRIYVVSAARKSAGRLAAVSGGDGHGPAARRRNASPIGPRTAGD